MLNTTCSEHVILYLHHIKWFKPSPPPRCKPSICLLAKRKRCIIQEFKLGFQLKLTLNPLPDVYPDNKKDFGQEIVWNIYCTRLKLNVFRVEKKPAYLKLWFKIEFFCFPETNSNQRNLVLYRSLLHIKTTPVKNE